MPMHQDPLLVYLWCLGVKTHCFFWFRNKLWAGTRNVTPVLALLSKSSRAYSKSHSQISPVLVLVNLTGTHPGPAKNKRSSIWQLCRHYDNLRCHRWRQSCLIHNLMFSMPGTCKCSITRDGRESLHRQCCVSYAPMPHRIHAATAAPHLHTDTIVSAVGRDDRQVRHRFPDLDRHSAAGTWLQIWKPQRSQLIQTTNNW